jgi:aspartyl-tRNA(Asn)/glutamyl-tRNA(Gln) amidotransferase subunit A
MKLNELTIKKAAQGMAKKEFSSLELTQAVFKYIKKNDPDVGAYLLLTEDSALATAKEIDERRGRGEVLGELAGIPVAIKDNILVRGVRCTAASKILENYIAPYDATVTTQLGEAGAVILGKTNLDEFAMGSSTENSAYQKTKNPRDLSRVPGGSSGGSVAAVAADEAIWALGSDTGGSIRQPASFCGVVGLKPTYGAVSRFGLMAMASSLDQIGPITKSVQDCQTVFGVLSLKDRLDSTSLGKKSVVANPEIQMKKLRIGLPRQYFARGLDPGVEKLVRQAIKKFEDQGALVKEVSLPHSEYALACYYIIMASEVSANLARYDGIKYGLSLPGDNLLDVYLASRQKGFGDEVRRRIMLGTYTLSAGYYDAYYLKAQKVRTLIKQDFENAFKEVDLIMTPTAPTTAFAFGEKTQDPVKMYLSDIYTVPVNLAGVPALSLPCGEINGLPVGLQIIGPQWGEALIFGAAITIDKK